MLIFWVFILYNIEGIKKCFGGMYCIHLLSSKMEAVSSSETLVNTANITRHIHPGDQDLNFSLHENLKCRIFLYVY